MDLVLSLSLMLSAFFRRRLYTCVSIDVARVVHGIVDMIVGG
jgi:hypothetical protein